MMKIRKANLKHWYDKPPKIIQNLGDALHAVSLFALGYAAITGTKWLAVIFIVVGAVGIGMQKLFKDDE